MTPPPWPARRYLQLSVAVALTTMGLKAAAWWATDAVSLLSDALESLVNLAGAVFAWLMVSVAAAPPDAEHPYGHHKAEYFSGGFEGLLILAAGIGIAIGAVERFLQPRPLESLGLGLGLSTLSSLLNGALGWAMLRAARAHRSMALEAGGRHLITDVWTSAGVVIGLLAVQATGALWIDPALAALLGLKIAWEGIKLVRAAVDGLMDQALEPELLHAIETVLARFETSTCHTDHLHSRRAGSLRYLDLHLHLPATSSLGAANDVRQALENALTTAVPGLRISLQLRPLRETVHGAFGPAPPA